MNKQKLLAIVGPTASGKTSLSILLAKRLGGEILSCDSMQIYRGMDIGTAKPTEQEKAGVPHHLLDLANADTPFSCAEYVRAASSVIDELSAKEECKNCQNYAEKEVDNSHIVLLSSGRVNTGSVLVPTWIVEE